MCGHGSGQKRERGEIDTHRWRGKNLTEPRKKKKWKRDSLQFSGRGKTTLGKEGGERAMTRTISRQDEE